MNYASEKHQISEIEVVDANHVPCLILVKEDKYIIWYLRIDCRT